LGHAGEDAIRSWFKNSEVAQAIKRKNSPKFQSDLEQFEGNAQGFRLLSRLLLPDNPGLELTYATLATFTKYPIEACVPSELRAKKAGAKKFGFFQSEKEMFEIVAVKTGLLRRNDKYLWWCRHPLAFLVEAADDICYRIIDFEDGYRLGMIPFKVVEKKLKTLGGTGINAKTLKRIKTETAKIQYLRAISIAKWVHQVARKFLELEPSILNGKFDAAFISEIESKQILEGISSIISDRVYPSPKVVEIEAAGFEVIGGLLDTFVSSLSEIIDSKEMGRNPDARSKKLMQLVPVQFHTSKKTPGEFDAQLRGIVDFVCGMTDSFAVSLYKKIKGISLT
jgi:dGTPase